MSNVKVSGSSKRLGDNMSDAYNASSDKPLAYNRGVYTKAEAHHLIPTAIAKEFEVFFDKIELNSKGELVYEQELNGSEPLIFYNPVRITYVPVPIGHFSVLGILSSDGTKSYFSHF